MIVYAESSAILAWLLDEESAGAVSSVLADAERIVVSVMTPLECGRTLRRNRRMGRLEAARATDAEQLLRTVSAKWIVVGLTDEVVERALGPFPQEPVRTLDAVHLATADLTRQSMGQVTMLTLDDRVRRNATELGLPILP